MLLEGREAVKHQSILEYANFRWFKVAFALSALVTLPAILLGFGYDWFRTGGSDAGAGRAAVIAVALALAIWSVALLALGLRTTFRLPWRGVAGALALAGVVVAAFAVLPTVL